MAVADRSRKDLRKELEALRRRIAELETAAPQETADASPLLERFFDQNPLLIAILDRNFNFIRVNRAYAAASRKTPDFFPGRNHFELYPHQENQRIFEKVRDTGRLYRAFAKPFAHPDQPERNMTYWDWTLTPLCANDGAISELSLSLLDVTERQKWEISIHENAEQARTIAGNLPGLVYQLEKTIDGAHRFRFVGEGARGLFNRSPEEVLADPEAFFSLVHPDDRQSLWETIEESEKTLYPFFHEHRLLLDDGTEKWVQTRSTPARTTSGATIWNGLALDVTDRKRAEERLRAVFHMSLDIICVADIRTATFLQVNPAFMKTLGYSEAELLGRPFLDFIHPDDVAATIATVEKELRKGNAVLSFENRYRRKDGQYRWLEWKSQPDPAKGITFAIAHDVTERKSREENLQRRGDYLQALNEVAALLLEPAGEIPWQGVVERIGPASDASRSYVFLNETDAEGRLLMNQKAEWCANGIEPEIDNPFLQGLSYEERCPRWKSILARGETISGRVRDFPESEREDLSAQGVLAILAIPLSLDNKFIGFIGFDNCRSEIEWGAADQTFLKAAANMLIQSLQRRDDLEALRKSRERLDLALRGTRAGLWELDLRADKIRIDERAAKMVGYQLNELKPVASAEWLQFCHPEDAPTMDAALRDCLEGISRFLEIECRVQHKDGHWVWVSDRGMVVEWDEDGTPIRMAGTAIDIGDKKSAELALQRNRDLLANAERLAGVGSWEWNIPSDRWEFSENWRRIHGVCAESLTSGELIQIAHPEDAPAIRDAFREALEETGVYEIRHRIRRADDGEIRHILACGELERTADGRPRRLSGAAQDVTEKARIETALRQSETEYRMIVENQADLVVKVDPEGRFLFVSPSYCRLFGKSRDELLGQTFMPLVHEADREATAEAMKALFRPPHEAFIEQRAMTRDGWRWLSWSDKAILNESGEVSEIVGVGRDITYRKKAEADLRESESRYRALFDNAPLGMFTSSPEGRFTAVNQALADMLGYSTPEELVASVTDIAQEIYVHPERRAEIFEIIRNGNDVVTFENEYFRRDGETFIANLNVVIMGEESGNPPYLLGMVEDITERKRGEKERLALEQKIQETQKLESLGVLAGGIAHDFNNILMAVLGNADLALDRLPAMSPARENLREIEHASRRAADLCSQMLAYSGKGKFVIEPIDLSALVKEMRHLLDASTSKKAVLRLELAEGVPAVRGDATQIRQVVMNLVINASEAIGERSGMITVSTGVRDCDAEFLEATLLKENVRPGRFVFLAVSDTGCGMTAETRRRVFEPFFTTKFTGRGLGMSAVLGIVRGHKGTLILQSEPGQGTEFTLLFPALSEAVEIPARAQPNPGERETLNGCILLVDDEETIRALGRQMLERIGFEVITARDGADALMIYENLSDRIDLVLLDLTMPKMDGEEAMDALLRFDPNVRIVLSSGYSEHEISSRFSGRGLAGFLQKPYTLSRLRERLGQALAGERPVD
ncbi:MAG: PAS domain S-box protein [Desulfococcaceae bacterium]